MPTPPRVFLSYSHDSDAHRERVLALSEQLRADGIPTILDRYVNGTPPEGWPRWMLDRLDESDRVLLICTPTSHSPYKSILFMVKRPGPRAKRSSRSHQSILLAWTRPGRAYPHRLGLHQGFWMGTHGVSRTSRMGCPLSGIGSASLGK